MKKLLFCVVALTAFSFAGMANNKVEEEKTVAEEKIVVLDINEVQNDESVASVKCWLFGKWLKNKLTQISDDDELIDATVDAVVELCEVADD